MIKKDSSPLVYAAILFFLVIMLVVVLIDRSTSGNINDWGTANVTVEFEVIEIPDGTTNISFTDGVEKAGNIKLKAALPEN